METLLITIEKAIELAKQVELFAIENGLSHASIFVMPSEYEDISLATIEINGIRISKRNREWRVITEEKE